MIKEYPNMHKEQISTHFNTYDFRCKCKGNHKIFIDTDLIDLLEALYNKIGAKKVKVISGYRCPKHDKAVGGSGHGSHTTGKAADIKYYKNALSTFNSNFLCVTLQNMNDYKGIGYRCGGVSNTNGETHIDVKDRQWYGNEAVSMSKAVTKYWYKYFKITYKTLTTMNVRKQPTTKALVLKKYKKGTKFVATGIINKENENWLKCKDGYVCLNQKEKVYCEISSIK